MLSPRPMTDPDGPQPPITSEQLEQIRALALAGAMPSRARRDFGDTPSAELAWVVACCWFLKKTHPDNARIMAPPLYAALDRLEMQNPGDWADIHNDIEELLGDEAPRDAD